MAGQRIHDNEPHPALSGLLRSLPRDREPISEADKARFMETFRAVLDYVYPTAEMGSPSARAQGGPITDERTNPCNPPQTCDERQDKGSSTFSARAADVVLRNGDRGA